MGNDASLPMNCAAFDSEEIKRLGKRFKKLDLDGSGSLSIEEFMSLPELQQNPLVRRVIGETKLQNHKKLTFSMASTRYL